MSSALGSTRLVAQGLITRPHPTPAAAVTAFAAMQGQDLPGVLASAALRTPSNSIDDVLTDLDEGRVVRGYPMRGTVFLMPAADTAWITELCAGPSVRAANHRKQQLGLDQEQLGLARDLAAELLTEPHSRAELFTRWDEHGLRTKGGRGYHLLFHLIAEGTVVYGPWNGGEQDVVLASAWLPPGNGLEGRFNGDLDAATAELLRRYLTTRGPATVRDFAWWTKLTLAQVRRGLALIRDEFDTDGAEEPSYWRPGLLEEAKGLGAATAAPLLLPGFDEFVLGYQDRLFAMTVDHHQRLVPGNNGVFKRSVVLGGRVVGVWTRSGRPGRRQFEVDPFVELSQRVAARLEKQYAAFPFVAQ
ncbi:crosslink repair DNA glycosylase YcaQ family protein [Tessaracoccus lubricantis]|uniref:Crosslink repair DNA glycosylase YcaQ family protein n=1 Tax=Tessaracoccus lubricantis TaxID=545543 RepID=A0ABP9F1M1_9ACTN